MRMSIRFFAILACSLLAQPYIYAQTTYFTEYKTTNSYHQYVGKISFESGSIQNNNDELGVFVSNNDNEPLLIGACKIGNNYPGYYFVTIFADDSVTATKDGANVGDTLTFKIWDQSENKLYVLSNAYSLSREFAPGITYPDLPPIFKSGFGEQFGYLNLLVRNQDLNENVVRFHAISQQSSIKLTWSTDCERNLLGFQIFRNSPLNPNDINITPNLIKTKGNELKGADYCFIDKTILSNIFYNYQLIGIDLNGQPMRIQTIKGLSVRQANLSHMDFNDDHQLGLPDIIELMKRIAQ